jgi:uncharacterized SAM-dependent methyltransferase
MDFRKDQPVLHAAYNDLERVTAAFNRNFLMRLKRELGAAFRPRRASTATRPTQCSLSS